MGAAGAEPGADLAIVILASNRRRANNEQKSTEGSVPIQWTAHIPQAMQQHGASRKPRPVAAEGAARAEQKLQSGWPNQAEDVACRWTATPDAQPSRP